MPRIWYSGELVDAVVVVNETTFTSGETGAWQDGTLFKKVYVVNASG